MINHVSGRGQYYEYGASGGTGVQEGEQNKLLSASKTQVGVGLIIAGAAASTYIVVNDITGIGVADDWLLGPAGALITEGGRILIYGY